MKMFDIDDVEGSTHKPRKYNTTEKLHRLDHVIVHTGWRPFVNGNTEAYGVGYIRDTWGDEYAVEWVDEEGEERQSMAWIPREYLEKTSKSLDYKDVGDVDDINIISSESDITTLEKLAKKFNAK